MKPERPSQSLLGVTRSQAKMFEYGVPEEHHISITQDPARLLTLTIAFLGDLASAVNREEVDEDAVSELRKSLLFSARFFDSYFESRLNDSLDSYLKLLGSASYYLSDLPGSASVLASRIEAKHPDLDGDGLESLLLWMLKKDNSEHLDDVEGRYRQSVDEISRSFLEYFKSGVGEEALLSLATRLREDVYESGTPRQLLLGDGVAAVLRKKIENSTWKALPAYSEQSRDKWLGALSKDIFIKELWPAQHLLGKAGVLKGRSAVVQMPTSAGKTKATELILRSAFLAERASLAVIVAPFRALCHEIKNGLADAFRGESTRVDELSDVLQADFDIAEILGQEHVLVVTPEKLLYVLRHEPDLGSRIGLLIFDEGHQFDSGTRGITYELLLTSLRSMIHDNTQKVLISAVISNGESVGEWLNNEKTVVNGTSLSPTFRSVGFASWKDQLGRIEYVNSSNAEENDFFVPRVIEQMNLGRKGRERNDRFFPQRDSGQSVALYLGLRLVSNGGVAVFCGTKPSAAKICESAVELFWRSGAFAPPIEYSDLEEVDKLSNLYVANIGEGAPASQSAAYGIFSHHGNTPHGIRLAVEHAMRVGRIRFVVCTSTLAQGVNLPIRYLIVTSVRQGVESMKVRDFHNLIGRAGRAGMHTEGSILFADTNVYDERRARRGSRRWTEVKGLLDYDNSEPCISSLLSMFEPIKSDGTEPRALMSALEFASAYTTASDVSELVREIAEQHQDIDFARGSLERQIAWKINLISAVESFLLAHWDDEDGGLSEEGVIRLSEQTLAFFLADDQEREYIRKLFILLSRNISNSVADPVRRNAYGKTLYGVQDAQTIEQWVQESSTMLLSATEDVETIEVVWPMLTSLIREGIFTKFDSQEALKKIVLGWINGKSFGDLLRVVGETGAKKVSGSQRRDFKIDDIVDVCENSLGYHGALAVGALCEFIEMLDDDGVGLAIAHLRVLQKRLKYGLPDETTIAIYELGFSDRVISQDLAESLDLAETNKQDILEALRQNQEEARAAIEKYPAYFNERMNELL